MGFFLNEYVDHQYYKSSALLQCKDGFKKFTIAQLNDDFCDCPDGTDEPGLSHVSFFMPIHEILHNTPPVPKYNITLANLERLRKTFQIVRIT